jgi:TPR repeat protein
MWSALGRPRSAGQRRWMKRVTKKLRRGDMAGAFRCATRAARRGDRVAQFSLGLNYLGGNDSPPSVASAAIWFERAAQAGHVDAMAQLAKLALRGICPASVSTGLFADRTSSPKYDQALLWAKRAASGGSLDGAIILAALFSDGPEDLRDREAACALLEDAAARGSGPGCLSLALLLARMPAPDPSRMTELLLTAAEAGVPTGIYLCGVAKEFAFGCEQDLVAAAAFYRRSAELGVPSGQTRLGHALLDGIGVPRDRLEGETWLRKAAANGDARAAARLGDFYVRDNEMPSFVEASVWFGRAVELGHAPAARILGFLHLTGMGLHEDRREAARWFQMSEMLAVPGIGEDVASHLLGYHSGPGQRIDIRGWFERAALSNDPLAAYRLAVCFAIGLGGERDDPCAVKWLRRAAPRLGAAQLLLGQMLLEGRGVARDETAARLWIEQAAATGLLDATVALAELLANGRGGCRDAPGALSLFRDAAGSGHLGALYAVGAMYHAGHGVVQDRILAQQWFRKAAEAGHAMAQTMTESIVSNG